MNISSIKALVPRPGVIQPIIQNTQVRLLNDQDLLYGGMQPEEHRTKRLHKAYDPYKKSHEDYPEPGGIVDIYV